MALFDDRCYTVCGVKFVYDGTPPEGVEAEYTHTFARGITLTRTPLGEPDIVARTFGNLPKGITRTMHDFEGNPESRVENGTAWLVFNFDERAREHTRIQFARQLDIALTHAA